MLLQKRISYLHIKDIYSTQFNIFYEGLYYSVHVSICGTKKTFAELK